MHLLNHNFFGWLCLLKLPYSRLSHRMTSSFILTFFPFLLLCVCVCVISSQCFFQFVLLLFPTVNEIWNSFEKKTILLAACLLSKCFINYLRHIFSFLFFRSRQFLLPTNGFVWTWEPSTKLPKVRKKLSIYFFLWKECFIESLKTGNDFSNQSAQMQCNEKASTCLPYYFIILQM